LKEAEFVRYLQETFPFSYGRGIGDDTSTVKLIGDGNEQLITKDLLVEGVHFSLEYFNLHQLALKSLAVNLSDIAAMGGEPLYFYLGLAYPDSLPKEKAFEFFKGLEEGCRRWNVQLAGGDYSSSPIMMISITAIGQSKNPVYRHNAQMGDLIGITGPTGESNLGLKLLQAGQVDHPMVSNHLQVSPEIRTGPRLALFVNAMIDVSDGLIIDLKRILTASQKGAVIHYHHIPVTPQLDTVCRLKGWNPYHSVLAGGEDYVLLFTFPPQHEGLLKKEGIPYHIIGEITEKPGLSIDDHGQPIEIDDFGYDHFK
jgi:thiamine-monophosphate kinase